MRRRESIPLLWLLVCTSVTGNAGVVINEIFYNAPNDVEDLEYIELHNSGDRPEDLSGWRFSKGIRFTFPLGARIEAKGFLVLCRNPERFKQFYDVPIGGVFEHRLSNKGQRLEFSNAAGRVVDSVEYQDRPPWPAGADGLSGSLERICPEARGDDPANWASSPLSDDRIKPAGTPGKANASFSTSLPPVISNVTFAPENPEANQPMVVQAEVSDPNGVPIVSLLYRRAGPGFETPESALPMKERSPGRFTATIPGQAADQLVRFRIQAISKPGARRFFPSETEPRPALSTYVHGPVEPAKIPFVWIINTTEPEFQAAQHRTKSLARAGANPAVFGPGGRAGAERAKATATGVASSRSALVYFDPDTARFQLFDFAQVAPHSGGQKVHFAKGQLLAEMSVINLTVTDNERSMLAEPLAYAVYRSAGAAAAQCYPIRLWDNGLPAGYHLLVEQPTRAFLRRNHLPEDGNLYRVHGRERGVVRQHEKKTNTREGHEDIVALVDALEKTKDEARWEVIRKNFDVEQVVNYFATCMVLSDWDGFSNNYFTYHELKRKGKWTMYPWDQDQTWGIIGLAGPSEVFYDLPISFGMEGDAAPAPLGAAGSGPDSPPASSPDWWQPGGCFSRPLLATPQFRRLFLDRVKELLATTYTEDALRAKIRTLGENLRPEVKLRAELLKRDPDRALAGLQENLQALDRYLKKRREFLLAQENLKN